MHREGRLQDAEMVYRRILEVFPEHPDVLHFLGLLKHHSGRQQEAAELIRRAIAQVPDFPDYHLNLGNVLVESHDIPAAIQEYRRTLELRPDFANAWNNLGTMQRYTDRHEEAERSYLKAIELAPEHVDAHNNLGSLYSDQGDAKRATDYFCRAIVLQPDHPDGHKLLGVAWYLLGETAKAAEAFREWLRIDPDNPEAQHLVAATSGEPAPERCSDAYLEYTFDHFASSFEQKLVSALKYRAPDLLHRALEERLPPPQRQYRILDAGCGTGLCGPLLKPWASELVGVDLSGGMLAEARNKQCYDHLEKAELTAWLGAHTNSFDHIVSADTLCYFGALETIIGTAAAALKPGGTLAFTVERIDDTNAPTPHEIEPSGRYRHSPDYVRRCLGGQRMTDIELSEAVLRHEGGIAVPGLVVLARRA